MYLHKSEINFFLVLETKFCHLEPNLILINTLIYYKKEIVRLYHKIYQISFW